MGKGIRDGTVYWVGCSEVGGIFLSESHDAPSFPISFQRHYSQQLSLVCCWSWIVTRYILRIKPGRSGGCAYILI